MNHYSHMFFSLYPGIIADCAHVFGQDVYCNGVLWRNSFTMACIGPMHVVERLTINLLLSICLFMVIALLVA